ncbi:MAG: phosphoglucosamine mutase [bacterium]|nr:phosphoglucosamine mutase [bacterium]
MGSPKPTTNSQQLATAPAGRIFGTDGVRGEANVHLTPELAFKLGRYGAYHLAADGFTAVMIGKDTRLSGDMLEAAVAAGAASVGVDVHLLGVLPTPAVAWLVSRAPVAAGIVISASHNPFEDNGIKFFSSQGLKLPMELEARIEDGILSGADDLPRPQGRDVGKIWQATQGIEDYTAYLKTIPGGDLRGLKVVIDCANGAASAIMPDLLTDLGAEVVALHCEPDGLNINEGCGSLHPQVVRQALLESGADLGLAFDGDADRLIAVDDKGDLLDGDDMVGMLALQLKAEGKLCGDAVVVTVMSNLGLERALERHAISVVRTDVGDRNVLEEMLRRDIVLGGEQSGHMIINCYNTTGDGAAAALAILRSLRLHGKPLSALKFGFERYPQVLLSITVEDKDAWQGDAGVQAAMTRVQEELGQDGRLYIRPSGTENKIRVMVEGPDKARVESMAEELADIIKNCS